MRERVQQGDAAFLFIHIGSKSSLAKRTHFARNRAEARWQGSKNQV